MSGNNQNSLSQRKRTGFRLVQAAVSTTQTDSSSSEPRNVSNHSDRQIHEQSESNQSLRIQIKNHLCKHRDFIACHNEESIAYCKKIDPKKLSYMRELQQNGDYPTASKIQQFEINALSLFKKVIPTRKDKTPPECYHQLEKKCKLPIKEWIKAEIAELTNRPQSNNRDSKNSKQTSQVKMISVKEMSQMDQSRSHKRTHDSQQAIDLIKSEKPYSPVSVEILEQQPAQKRQKLDVNNYDKCFVNIALIAELHKLLIEEPEFSISPPKNFAALYCLQRSSGTKHTFAGFVPSISSVASRNSLNSSFQVQNYLLGNSQLQILLFLTKEIQLRQDEKDFVLGLMKEKGIPLVCLKQQNKKQPSFLKEDFFCISSVNPTKLEPAKNIYFDNQLGWHIIVQFANGIDSNLRIISESAPPKECGLLEYCTRLLSQNRNSYTLDLVTESVHDNILEPLQDHEFSKSMIRNHSNNMICNQDAKKWTFNQMDSHIHARADESTDHSTNSSKTNKNGVPFQSSGLSESSSFSQLGHNNNKFTSASNDLNDFNARMQFEQQRGCASSAQAKQYQTPRRIEFSPAPVSEFQCEPYPNNHHLINPPSTPSQCSHLKSLCSPTSYKSNFQTEQSPGSQFTSYSLRAQQQSQQFGHPMSETIPNYADPIRFPQFQKRLREFIKRPQFDDEKEFISFNEYIFCYLHFEDADMTIKSVICSRQKGYDVTLGMQGGEPKIRLTGNLQVVQKKQHL